ncbi:MAG: hypothetical protein A3F67_03305 [Verrucomicrobia bacterium RIFCSPHIGHO2_12_FULL_41_10]|nr:MAG: hypothetical protein A3F67_03305 [Verrucomicrobia bacterium RIFCSPHIGHO2_12_FULL_41_10]HLB34835.1 hypothetical protein [Chthoniobacterales bacterium]
MHPIFFLQEYLLTFLAIILFGFCGYGTLTFFLENQELTFTQIILISPFNGIIMSVLGIILLYTCGISFTLAIGITVLLLTAISIYYLTKNYRSIKFLIVLPFFIIAFLISLLCNSNALKESSPSIQMIDGSDAMGYSMSADWIRMNTIKRLPGLNASDPYEVLPYQNLRTDQRLGSFAYLALISAFAHRSAFFSYNLAVTIAITIFIMGLAAVVSSRWICFYLTSLLLGFSQLIDLANAGYFGKMLGYPAILLLLLLVLRNNTPSAKNILYYSLLIVGASSLYSYISTFVLFSFTIFLFLFYQLIFCKKSFGWNEQYDECKCTIIYVLATLTFIAFACSGGFLVLLGGGPYWQRGLLEDHPFQLKFKEILFYILNIDYIPSLVHFPGGSASFIIFISIIILIIVCSSIFIKNRIVFIIIMLPLSIITVLIATGRYWGAYQMALLFYLCSCLAIGLLLNELFKYKTKKARVIGVLFFIMFAIPHLPLFIAVTNRFAYSSPDTVRYAEAEFKKLKAMIGHGKVMIDTTSVYDTQPLLLEFGRDQMSLFFTARAWILTGWGLSYPEYLAVNHGENCSFRILPAGEKCELPWVPVYIGRHYQLASKG